MNFTVHARHVMASPVGSAAGVESVICEPCVVKRQRIRPDVASMPSVTPSLVVLEQHVSEQVAAQRVRVGAE